MSIVDEHSRECLGGLVERNITGRHLIDELDRLAVDRGYPAVLRCDSDPELACAAMADWAGERVGLYFIPFGQPWRNGYIESFNSRVRDECLTASGPRSPTLTVRSAPASRDPLRVDASIRACSDLSSSSATSARLTPRDSGTARGRDPATSDDRQW